MGLAKPGESEYLLRCENGFVRQWSLVSSWYAEGKWRWDFPKAAEGTYIHHGPQSILAKDIYANMKGWRSLWPWREDHPYFWRIMTVVLCPLVVICVIGWQWSELASSLPSDLSCFEESPFQILPWPVPASCVVRRCADLVANPSPQSPLHSQLWLAADRQITWAKPFLYSQHVFSLLPYSCFVRKFLKNRLLTIAPAITDCGKCLGTCACAHDGNENFAKMFVKRKNWASVVRKLLVA